MRGHRAPRRTRPGAVCAILAILVSAPAQADTVTVVIEGVDGRIEDNVRTFLSIAAEPEAPRDARRIRRLHARASGEIESALQPFGYYRPAIDAQLRADGDHWTARYHIDRGPATRITDLVLRATGEGATQREIERAIAESELAEGDRLVHSRYKATKNALIQAAHDTGYLDAAYQRAQIRVHPEEARAEVILVLATGPRYYFGEVSIEQDILSDAFVRRYLGFQPGDPFDTDRLTDLQLALSDTGYFSQIEIEADRDRLGEAAADPSPRLPVVIRAKPRKPRKYTASVGYGTDTGPRVGLGAEFRRLNRRGHTFRTDLRLSEIEQVVSARYSIPIDNVVSDRLAFGATAKQEELGDAVSDSYALSATRADGWRYGRRRFYLNLERENFDFGGPGRTSNLLYPGVTLSFQRADDALRTRRGISVSADLHGGSDALVSSTNFVQAALTGKAVAPLADDVRLLVRSELGATETDDFAALPPSQRFFAGGDRSVRGYGYQEIGPENAAGDDIGGQYLATASVEAEYLFYGDFGAAVFFDAGDAARDVGKLDARRGVGLGFRWLSPVGTVRLDLAHPLDDPDSEFRIHFSLGPDL